MTKTRLEAFSDGVIAIIITIMVLELRAPEEGTLAALATLTPKFLSYLLSFVLLGIYWNNHHMNLLFWLSLVPFGTIWIGEHFETVPVAIYGMIHWIAGFSYFLLTRALIAHHGNNSMIANAIGKDTKGLRSLYIYTIAVIVAFFSPVTAMGLYVLVVIMWVVPDRRIEEKITETHK
jgi:uncharacterized membrane protein